MGIAVAVSQRANCLRGEYRVGAVIVKENHIFGTGYNGTPSEMQDCIKEGCTYCRDKKKNGKSQLSVDHCICVHAEQNALLSAARFGISVRDATIFSTVRPCPTCSKEMIQAGIKAVTYLKEWGSDHADYEKQELKYIQAKLKINQFAQSLPLSFHIGYQTELESRKKAA